MFLKPASGFPPRRGQIIPLVVVSLAALVGVAGLVVDGANLMSKRWEAQAAADASAWSAAVEMAYNSHSGVEAGSGPAHDSAWYTTTQRGFARSSVAVNIPPNKGDFAGNPYFAEVIITVEVPTSFAAIFGIRSQTVHVRAVATAYDSFEDNGIIILDPHDHDALFTQNRGQGKITVTNASIKVNSDWRGGGQYAGNAVNTISARQASISLVGAHSPDKSKWDTPTLKSGTTPVPDPLINLPTPRAQDYPAAQYSTDGITWKDVTTDLSAIKGDRLFLTPGVYPAGIRPTKLVKNDNRGSSPRVYLLHNNPGRPMGDPVFFIQTGGIAFYAENGVMTTFQSTPPTAQYVGDPAPGVWKADYSASGAHGILVYDTGKGTTNATNFSNNARLVIDAPTSGTYQKLGYFLDRSSTNRLYFGGGSQMTVNGTVYAAKGTLSLETQLDMQINGQLVAGKLWVTSSGSFNLTWERTKAFRTPMVSFAE